MPYPRRIEGYAIVSEDGMLANASGIMPDQLKFEADQNFFERGLDGVDVVVHGRHSHERQRRSDLRRRLLFKCFMFKYFILVIYRDSRHADGEKPCRSRRCVPSVLGVVRLGCISRFP